MKVLRSAVLAAVSAAVLLTGTPAHAAGVVIVQGESATAYSSGCGDGGDGWDMGPVSYGGRMTLGFPASGCWASYQTAAKDITSAEVITSGQAPTICGTVTVSGTTTGSATFCTTNDTVTPLTFNPPVVSATGAYTVTWTTGPGTASYCNLFLDFLVGVG